MKKFFGDVKYEIGLRFMYVPSPLGVVNPVLWTTLRFGLAPSVPSFLDRITGLGNVTRHYLYRITGCLGIGFSILLSEIFTVSILGARCPLPGAP